MFRNPSNHQSSSNSNKDSSSVSIEDNNIELKTISYHWFYKTEIDGKIIWEAFSRNDSENIERAYLNNGGTPNIIQTNGGRYDVNIKERTHTSIYWVSSTTEVRRCSWFYKGSNVDGRFIPYTEDISEQLENEYKYAYNHNKWHHTVDLLNGEYVIFHGPDILVHFINNNNYDNKNVHQLLLINNDNDNDNDNHHYQQQINNIIINDQQQQNIDKISTSTSFIRPRVVKRASFNDLFDIDEVGETNQIDHLVFMVHGVGSRCDLKLRSIVQVVNDFRMICQQLIKSHYKTSYELNKINRIEILPISWHDKLHRDEETGIDKKLKNISLDSIPLLRDFTNDTILDALCYTSPIYSQTIITCVGSEMNRLYDLFKERNPLFNGGVSLAGHSLGSLIIFDILLNQKEEDDNDDVEKEKKQNNNNNNNINNNHLINYPHLKFQPLAFFALGSPISMFITIRGLDTLGLLFKLPTCSTFLNIFHPYDPVAYRIESLINPAASMLPPVLIPHHKGRKRMHLELKETMLRVGTDIKHKFIYSLRNTWNIFYDQFINNNNNREITIENQQQERYISNNDNDNNINNTTNIIINQEEPSLGVLNQGRRIDYVLQEAPVEFFNEYLFALQSHVCYWESEDTILLILKEIYDSLGVKADNQIPQQTMTIHPDSDPDPDPDSNIDYN